MNTPHELIIKPEADGRSTRVDLMMDRKSISRLWLTPFTLHIGAARVRMEGVGGVGTDEAHRSRGHSRRVIEAAIEHMKRGDAALSMLYGIPDFYPKFGFATAGPDYLVLLAEIERSSALPAGWAVRAFAREDLAAIQSLYSRGIAGSVGAAERAGDSGVWNELVNSAGGAEDSCRVVLGPDGAIHAYLWRARWCWYVKHSLEPKYKRSLVIGEVMADGPAAADALLAAARLWAREQPTASKIKEVLLACPPEGPLAAAASRQDVRFISEYSACGGSMARVLSVRRLLEALAPELSLRLRAAPIDYAGSSSEARTGSRARPPVVPAEFAGALVFQTDMGAAALIITRGAVSVVEAPSGRGRSLTVSIPQAELARLALGAFPPEDVLARLPDPPSGEAAGLLSTLFPARRPHMSLPDRY